MDESSQGSVELIEGVEMVSPHVEKLGGAMREEYLHTPCIDIHRNSGGSTTGTLLTTDLMQTHIHPQMVEEFTTHAGQEYYEHHILQEHDLADADRHLVELAVVEEPQNLSTPVMVEKGGIAAMLSAYIHTSGDMTPTHQIIIDSGDRSVKMFQQQRLPSLSSLPPIKKNLSNSTIRSRYLRPHHDEEVTLTPMTNAHHTLDGTNVIVGQHIVQEGTVEGHRLLATTDSDGNTILVEDHMTPGSQRLITQDTQRILVAQDATMGHSLATSSGTHRLSTLNGHRMLDVQTDHNTRYLTHQEASVVTSMASQRLIAQTHTNQVQTQAEIDVAERLLDEESPEHQMLVQEQLIHVVLDQNAQAELGVVVPTPGQRVLLQGPEGWTTRKGLQVDPASCEPETGDHDSSEGTIVEISDQTGLIVKHEEVDIAEGMVEEVDGMDGSADGVAEGSDGDAPMEDMNDSDFDGEGDMRTSRRSLPHKKRLSKKLRNPRKSQSPSQPQPKIVHAKFYKCNKCSEQFATQAALAAHRFTHNTSNKKGGLSFSCEICGKNIPNQLKFFEHLKAHYEPGAFVDSAVPSPSSSLTVENGSAHQKVSDRGMNTTIIVKDDGGRIQQHIVELQQSQPQHQSKQPSHEQPFQSLHEQPQTSQRHIQRQVSHLQVQRHTRHTEEYLEEHVVHQGAEIILKVENVPTVHNMNKSQQHQIHLPQIHQLHNGRIRSLKCDQDIQQQQQHQTQPSRQSNQLHSQQSSLQQTVMESEPPPLVPILPPVSTITGSLISGSNLTCNLCNKNFKHQKRFETHLSVAHPKQEDIEQFSDPEDMMEGIREVVEAGEESDNDSESMVRLTTLTTHGANSLSKSHPETWYQDEDISATEADLQALQRAENEHHQTQEGIRHETSEQLQQSQQQQQQHQQSRQNHLELNHMCELCGDAFHSKARLNQHLRIEHLELRQKGKDKNADEESDESPRGKKPLRRLACTQCDRVFNHRNSLVYHLRSHSGERPHQCEECGKSFFATSALKVHMRLHSGDKPYKCEFCGRNFRQWGDLKYHCTSRHSEEKQYQCEYCGKDFARKYSLIVHRRIHTGEKDYVCEFCNKKFRASSYLQNHRRIHTGEKPHRCEICDKPFRVRSDMKRHLNTHNRERQRAPGSSTPGATSRGNSHKVEAGESEADVDAPDSQDALHQDVQLHELDNATTITVMKSDTDGMEILPDPSNHPQTSTTISLSSHTTDAGLQYASDRDPLELRQHATATTQSGQLVYVLPTSYYM